MSHLITLRYYLPVLLLVFSFSLLSITPVKAFTTSTPACDLGNWDWQIALDQELGHVPDNDTKFVLGKNHLTQYYVLFYIPTGATGNNLDLYANGGGDYAFYINAKRAYYNLDGTHNSTTNENFSGVNMTCINYVNNPTMDDTNGAFPVYDFSPAPPPDPDPEPEPEPTPTTQYTEPRFGHKVGFLVSLVMGYYIIVMIYKQYVPKGRR